MVDLAMHMMDIVQNSIRAEAKNIRIDFLENAEDKSLIFRVKDDGTGMSSEILQKLSDPFFTTRTTRKVGLGVPFLKMTSEQTGGFLKITSELGVGTEITALYKTDHPDCLPVGDIGGYLMLLLVANPRIHFSFHYELNEHSFSLDTSELTNEGITDLQNAEIAAAIKEYINENLKQLFTERDSAAFLC